jgi:hypothetical protein
MEVFKMKLYCPVLKKVVDGSDNCRISSQCLSCMEAEEVKDYCTMSVQDCKNCCFASYNKDCKNNYF